MPFTNVNGIVFVIQQSPSQFHIPASQFCIWRLSFMYYPRKSGALPIGLRLVIHNPLTYGFMKPIVEGA